MKKVIINKYILGVGEGKGGIEITDSEAEALIGIFSAKPIAESGYEYKLRADTLEWELVEVPIEEQLQEEISDSEALDIITGNNY